MTDQTDRKQLHNSHVIDQKRIDHFTQSQTFVCNCLPAQAATLLP